MQNKKSLFILFVGVFNFASCFAIASALPKADSSAGIFIVGGIEEKPNSEISQQTVLITGSINNRGSFTCSGTIVGQNMILTAAHCLGGNLWADLVVHFKNRQSDSGFTAKVIDRRAGLARIPADGQEFDWGDVAVVKIQGSIPNGYKPVVLASEDFLKDQDEVTLAGYGKTTALPSDGGDDGAGILRSVQQNILQSRYGQSEILVSIKDRGACSGDSGGPAFASENGKLVQVGIASRLTKRDIIPGGKKDVYACITDLVYSKISFYNKFIQDAIQAMSVK